MYLISYNQNWQHPHQIYNSNSLFPYSAHNINKKPFNNTNQKTRNYKTYLSSITSNIRQANNYSPKISANRRAQAAMRSSIITQLKPVVLNETLEPERTRKDNIFVSKLEVKLCNNAFGSGEFKTWDRINATEVKNMSCQKRADEKR